MEIHLTYDPPTPGTDTRRRQIFAAEEYDYTPEDDFQDVCDELISISVRLLKLLPDPSLGPNERLERLARVVPSSQLQSAHRRTARSKLYELRRRLEELVPGDELTSVERLEWLIGRLDELVPGDGTTISKLETIGDYRSTDAGVAPLRDAYA